MHERRPTPRTKERALKVLLRHLAALRKRIDDGQLQELLSDDLLRTVFELAWRHQFDDYRDGFEKGVRETVDIAIESLEVGA